MVDWEKQTTVQVVLYKTAAGLAGLTPKRPVPRLRATLCQCDGSSILEAPDRSEHLWNLTRRGGPRLDLLTTHASGTSKTSIQSMRCGSPLGAEATCVPSWPGRDADGKNKTWVLRNRAASLHLSGPGLGLGLGLGCVCIFGKKDLPRYDWELGPAGPEVEVEPPAGARRRWTSGGVTAGSEEGQLNPASTDVPVQNSRSTGSDWPS